MGLCYPKQEVNEPFFRLRAEFVSFIGHPAQAKGEGLFNAFAYVLAQKNSPNCQTAIGISGQQLADYFCFLRLQLAV